MNNRRDAIFILIITMAILVLANILGEYLHGRFDLTSERKYSIMAPSKKLLKSLPDAVTFKIYLEGDMSAKMRRMRQATRDMITEMRAYGGKKVEYEFIDPVNGKSKDEQKALFDQLSSKGLHPYNDISGKANQAKSSVLWPCAIAYYRGREFPIQLLESQIGFSEEEAINNSIISLEYKMINAVQKLTMYAAPQIAFSSGHGELNRLDMADIQNQLVNLRYQVATLDIPKRYMIDKQFSVLIIAKPRLPFSEEDKYKIDQFIMRGGKVIWLIDNTTADFDSLKVNLTGQFVTDLNLNLDDQLFKYGTRINTDLVQDINMCNPIPLRVGNMGNSGQWKLFPWYYFPLLIPDSKHPIVRNLDPVAAQFVSTIDTIRNPGVTKTILLRTTDNSKAILTPMRVHFGILQQQPNPQYYNQPRLPVAVLLEGQFQSLFRNRLPEAFLRLGDSIESLKFIEQSPLHSKMIVIGDGDIIRNEVGKDSTAFPLGYYSVTRQTLANKDFMLNCIQYLVDSSGILETRNKDVKLRLLNNIRVQNEKVKWQIINVLMPIIIVGLFGLGFGYLRRKRYAK